MNRPWHIVVIAALGIAAASVNAQTPVDVLHTWTDAGLGGWTNGTTSIVLSNGGGYLNWQFKKQSMPSSESDIVKSNVTDSILATNISFNFLPVDVYPSEIRLYIHSARSGNAWYANLPLPEKGVWTTYNVQVDFDAERWIMGPSSRKSQFQTDMLSMDWVGIYVTRHGSLNVQNYQLDQFRLTGMTIPENSTISGIVYYDGEQSGNIRVSAQASNGTAAISIRNPGNYSISRLPLDTDYNLSAYRDSNSNSVHDFWEAYGEYAGNPSHLYVAQLTGVNMTLTDPTSPDGLPYWWLHQYFGIDEPGGQGGSIATLDTDSDGMNNYSEYKAGTDPTNHLSVFSVRISEGGSGKPLVLWDSVNNRTYAVWRSPSMFEGFVKIAEDLPATPPENEYEDIEAPEEGSSFYRIQVE